MFHTGQLLIMYAKYFTIYDVVVDINYVNDNIIIYRFINHQVSDYISHNVSGYRQFKLDHYRDMSLEYQHG